MEPKYIIYMFVASNDQIKRYTLHGPMPLVITTHLTTQDKSELEAQAFSKLF